MLATTRRTGKDRLLKGEDYPEGFSVSSLNTAVKGLAQSIAGQNNFRFWKLHNQDNGVFGWRKGNPWRLPRRRFFETYLRIKNKKGDIVPFVLNDSQRRLEAEIIRQERRGLPVRIVIGKARQQGFSTYVAAFELWYCLTKEHGRACIIAHRRDTSKVIFQRLKLMSRKMRKKPLLPEKGKKLPPDEKCGRWDFDTPNDSGGELTYAEPLWSSCVIDSAEVNEPGRGDTIQVLHMSETAMWKDAKMKAEALLQVLPSLPGTYGFNESTAKGDSGWFRDSFMGAWQRQNDPTRPSDAEEEASAGWRAVFFPWFFHQEYRLSVVTGRPLSDEKARHIEETLDEEEQALLQQRYLRRGIGWVQVDLDQLAWRRWAIDNLCSGHMNTLHQEYPAAPREMFIASGSPFFDPLLLEQMSVGCVTNPVHYGELVPG